MPKPKFKPRFSPSLRLVEAFAYACHLHADQARKGGTIPYISHLMAVSAMVIEHGGGEDEAIAALLHDSIEDQNHDGSIPGEIRALFGSKVLALVRACSDSRSPIKAPWKKRKERYLKHVPRASAKGRLISAADKLHNARAVLGDYRMLGERLWKRFNAPRKDQLWYHRGLVTAFRHARKEGQTRALVDELDRVVTALELNVRTAEERPRKRR